MHYRERTLGIDFDMREDSASGVRGFSLAAPGSLITITRVSSYRLELNPVGGPSCSDAIHAKVQIAAYSGAIIATPAKELAIALQAWRMSSEALFMVVSSSPASATTLTLRAQLAKSVFVGFACKAFAASGVGESGRSRALHPPIPPLRPHSYRTAVTSIPRGITTLALRSDVE